MYGYIYITTNLINGKRYIGQKKSDRFLGNKYLGSGKILQEAVRKNGKENFKVDLLEECDTKEELDARERYYIKLFDAARSDDFYNIAIGGQTRAHIHTEEEKKHLSEIQIGKYVSEETRHRISIARKKHFEEYPHKGCSAEHRAKISAKMKGRKRSPEVCKQLSISHKGVPLSEYHKKRISENHADLHGDKNPIYGKIKVNNGKIAKYIKKEELDKYLELGYVKGNLPRNK